MRPARIGEYRIVDTWLFYAVNHGTENGLFDWLMPLITDYNIVAAIAIAAYLIWKDPKKGFILCIVIILAVTLSDFTNHRVFKEIFARLRPCNVLPDVHLLTGCSGSFSFPSSHAVNSFTVAAVFGFYNKKLFYITLPAAALVAYSRVYLGVHYPADVVVGALVGTGFGYLAHRIYRSSPFTAKPGQDNAAA